MPSQEMRAVFSRTRFLLMRAYGILGGAAYVGFSFRWFSKKQMYILSHMAMMTLESHSAARCQGSRGLGYCAGR